MSLTLSRRTEKIFMIVAIGLVTFGFFYSLNFDTVFGRLLDPFTPVVWKEVRERDIVKNSVPVTIVERNGDRCTLVAEKLDYIFDYSRFVKAAELANKLNYNKESKTIVLPCSEVVDDKSILHIWFVIKQAPKHPTKYEYFITALNSTQSLPITKPNN